MGSQMNPFTTRPSSSSSEPMPSGDGISATNEPKCSMRHIPKLDFDRRSGRDGFHQAGLRRGRVGERVQLISRCGTTALNECSVTRRQLMIEWHAGEMRADDCQSHASPVLLLQALFLRQRCRGATRGAERQRECAAANACRSGPAHRSCHAGAINVMPAGNPSSRNAAGSASADRSARLVKLV